MAQKSKPANPVAGVRLDADGLPPRTGEPGIAPPGSSRFMAKPPPIPSSWDAIAAQDGVPRESLQAFHRVYHAVYYEPNEPGLKFCRIRDITRGKVTLGANMQFHVSHSMDFWPRDVKQRDPLEQAWFYFVRQWILRPSIEVLFERSFQPKWIAPNEFMTTDQWVPLRSAAPVYCGIGALGTCITMYACAIHCALNGNITEEVPFLAVTPIDSTGSGLQAARQRMGIWWAVPLATCIPLRMAVLAWPTADSNNPEELTVLGEDGFAEKLSVNYFLESTDDPALEHARLAFKADNPGTATSAIPLKPSNPRRQAQMAAYTVTRYIPDNQVPKEDGDDDSTTPAVEEDKESEEATPAKPAATAAAAADTPLPSDEVDGEESPPPSQPSEPSTPSAPATAPSQVRMWKISELYPN